MATSANTVEKIQQFSYNTGNNTTVFSTDLRVQGNLTVVGGHVIAQTSTLIVQDNIITLNAFIGQSQTPVSSAGIEIDRGNQPNVSLMWIESEGAWKFTSDGITYDVLGGGSAGAYANGAFEKANSAGIYANGAFAKVNAVYQYANSTSLWGMRQAFIATPGQTTFSPGSGYVPGQVDVFYNGIKLYGTEDFTATDGVNVILTNPAGANAIVEVVGFGGNIAASNVYVLNSMASLLNRQTFIVPVHGQTVFTPSTPYRAGYVDVYYNGLKMVIPDDVVANNGTHIYFVGLTPTTNDVIEIVGLTPNVALANAIPITGGSVSGGLTLAGNVIPETTNTYYLGSETKRWHSLYVGPGSIDIGGLKLSNVGGTLSVSTPGSPATPIAGEDTWVRAQANAAFAAANNVAPQIQPAFDTANAAFNAANNASDTWVRNQANLAFDKANSALSNTNLNVSATLRMLNQGGDEGGEIFLDKPQTNTSLSAGITVDIYQNKLRIFETGGGIRGAFIDIANTTANGVGSEITKYDANTTSTGFLSIPIGTTAQRPAAAANGQIRYNTTLGRIEAYLYSAGWTSVLSDQYTVEYLIVAGGGAGAGGQAGEGSAAGGGAGGLLQGSFTVNPQVIYTVTVGAGGSSGPAGDAGNNGSNSSAFSQTAIGGGKGSQGHAAGGQNAGSGGSGGGGGYNGNTSGSGTPGQGYPGGNPSGATGSSGGGGAGAAGTPATNSTAGPGGIGINWQSLGTYYAGGGGGGRHINNSNVGSGGLGGGGDGGQNTSSGTAPAGGTNTGGGGGGGGENPVSSSTGGAGGSGIVIFRYQGAQRGTGGTVTSSGGYTYHTFTGSGSFTA